MRRGTSVRLVQHLPSQSCKIELCSLQCNTTHLRLRHVEQCLTQDDGTPYHCRQLIRLLLHAGDLSTSDFPRKELKTTIRGRERLSNIVTGDLDDVFQRPNVVGLTTLILGLFKLEGNQLREQVEYRENVVTMVYRLGIERTQRAKVAPVLSSERHGDITFNAIKRQPRVFLESRVSTSMVNLQGCDRTRDDTSVGCMEREVITGLDAKSRLVQHGARSPRVFCDPSDECDTHARRSMKNVKDCLNCGDMPNCDHIVASCRLFHSVRSVSPTDRLYRLSPHVEE